MMPESVSDSNRVKRKYDRTQVADGVLSTSPPHPLPSSILDKKISYQEISENLVENKDCSRMKKRSHKCSNCRKEAHNARTCPNVEENDVANSGKKCKRKFTRRTASEEKAINHPPHVVAKPVNNRIKPKNCRNCGVCFRKNTKVKTADRCW
ncbi:hypothetical protein P9112_011899 [Eukaryota sp. TZLM1-RC]